MKKRFLILLSCACAMLLLASALTLSVLATGSESDTAAQNTPVDPFDEAEGDRFYSGTCGDDLTWTLNVTTGKMRISGSGAMKNYDSTHSVPWYNYTYYIREVVIEDGVTSISQYAFSSCPGLNIVFLGRDVKSIGNYAFTGCTNIAEVCNTSALNITLHRQDYNTAYGYLGYWAKSIVKSASASKILRKDDFVFWKNSYNEYELLHYEGRDTDISLPEAPIGDQSAYLISDFAFYYDHQLTSVDIPNCVTKIGESAFTSCPGLTKLYIPDSVRTMSRFAISGCSNLLWVRLGSGLTNMGGEYAGSHRPPFNNCPSILEVCNDSQFEVVAGTYSQDTGITAEHVYSSDDGEPKLTFDGDFIYFDRDGVCTLIKYVGNSSEVVIPECIEAIDAKAFNTLDSIKKVVIPSSVQSIALSAFIDCKNITEIEAPFVGTSREETARLVDVFKNSADNLEKFTLTEGDRIHDSAFAYCYALKDISFPSGITYIGKNAFYCCEGLTSFTVPDSVVDIGKGAFDECLSLESITLPFVGSDAEGTVNSNFGYIFGADSYLQNPTAVPSSLETVILTGGTSISDNAFRGCSKIITVVLPETLEVLGASSFRGCDSLVEIYNYSNIALEVGVAHDSLITENALVIHTEPDAESPVCRADGFVFFRNGDTDTYTLMRYTGKGGAVVFPETLDGSAYTVTEITERAFYGRTDITSITLPEGVKTVGESAFGGCTALKTLTLPATIEVFPYTAISGCTSLDFNVSGGANYLGNAASPYHILVSIPTNELTEFKVQNSTKLILKNAFSTATNIETLTVPSDILHIDASAFSSSSKIKYLTAPAHALTSIPNANLISVVVNGGGELPENALYQATMLQAVTLPDTIEVIGQSAFLGCRSLKSIDLSNITSIGASAFEGCSALESVTLCKLTEISELCFKNCVALKSVTMGDGIVKVGKNAFYGCSALSSVHVGSLQMLENIDFANESANPLYLAKSLYVGGEKIESLIIPEGNQPLKPFVYAGINVTSLSIADGVEVDVNSFLSCAFIEKLTASADILQYIPTSALKELNVIAGEVVPAAFTKAFLLEKVTLCESIKTVSDRAFSPCAALKELHILSDAVAFGENAFFSSNIKLEKVFVATPETWLNMSFVNEKSNPLKDAELYTHKGEKIESITIPASVSEVPAYAFYKCASLKNVYFESADTTVGENAFSFINLDMLGIHISQLKSFSTHISSVKGVEILSGEVIPERAFYRAEKLESVTLCDSIKEIGNSAFTECYSLKSIVIPESVTAIGSYAFSYCMALESVTLPSTMTVIPSGLFSNCTSLVSVKIPDAVLEISESAFNSCSSLASIDYSGSALTTIGSYAFSSCSALTEVVIPDSVTTVERYAFAYCSSLETMCIPNTVTSFDAYALEHCYSLKSITCSIDHLDSPYLPALETAVLTGGTKLPGSIFYNCENIKNVTLPDTLTTIDEYALSDCDKITTLRIPASVTSIASNAFYKCSSLESIYVDSLEAWLKISFSSNANPLCYAKNLYVGDKLLTDLVVPEEWDVIGDYAFDGYKALKSVTLHGNMSVGYRAFYNSGSIEKVNISSLSDWLTVKFSSIESNPLYYAGTLYVGDEILTNIVIPEDITAIGRYAFAGIKTVETVYIPKTVTTFGSQMFEYAVGIKEIVCCSENYSNLASGIGWNVSTKLINHRYEIVAGEESHHWVCSECKTELSPENHSWSYDPIEKLSPTHTEPGYAIYSCVCGQTLKNTLEPTGHYFNYQTEYVAPTHTSEGKYVYACDCGETTTVPIEKLIEHQYDSGTVTVAPTHTEFGVMTYACECGESYTEEIPTLDEHEWGEWQVVDDYLHAKHCSCGISESDYHYFDNDYDTECNTCGFIREVETESSEPVTNAPDNTETDEVGDEVTNAPADEQTDSPSAPSEPVDKPSSSGGCSSSLGGASLAVSVMGAVALLFCRKKKED